MLARLRGDHRTSGGGREEVLVAEIERRTKSLEAVYLGNFAWMKGPSRDDEPHRAATPETLRTSPVRAGCSPRTRPYPLLPDTSEMVDIIGEHEGARRRWRLRAGRRRRGRDDDDEGSDGSGGSDRARTRLRPRRPGMGVDRGSTGGGRGQRLDRRSTIGGGVRGVGRDGDRTRGRRDASATSATTTTKRRTRWRRPGASTTRSSRLRECRVSSRLLVVRWTAVVAWFGRVPARHGVTVRRTESLGAGDGRCVIRVERRRDARRFVASNGEYQGKGS